MRFLLGARVRKNCGCRANALAMRECASARVRHRIHTKKSSVRATHKQHTQHTQHTTHTHAHTHTNAHTKHSYTLTITGAQKHTGPSCTHAHTFTQTHTWKRSNLVRRNAVGDHRLHRRVGAAMMPGSRRPCVDVHLFSSVGQRPRTGSNFTIVNVVNHILQANRHAAADQDEVQPAVHKTGRRGLWLRAVDGRQHVPPARHTRLAHVGESRGVLRASQLCSVASFFPPCLLPEHVAGRCAPAQLLCPGQG